MMRLISPSALTNSIYLLLLTLVLAAFYIVARSPFPSMVQAQGATDCFSNISAAPSPVATAGTFVCTFNYSEPPLSGRNLNCAILKNGQLVLESNRNVGCTYDRTEGKTHYFNCSAPSTADTYELVGYLDVNNTDGETVPASCGDRDVKTSLVVGGGGGSSPPSSSPVPGQPGITDAPGISGPPVDPATPVPTAAPPDRSCWSVILQRFIQACSGSGACISRAETMVNNLLSIFQGSCPNTPATGGNCWDNLSSQFIANCQNDSSCVSKATTQFEALVSYYGGACPGGSNPAPTGQSGSGTVFPTLPGGSIPTGLDHLLNPKGKPDARVIPQAKQCLANKVLYQQAVAMYKQVHGGADVPWQILSGFHHLETGGSCNTNQSMISGRKIGNAEPDRAGTCSPQDIGPCRTVPVPGGCGYRTFLDSACDGTRILVEHKLSGVPQNIEDLARGMAGYNGWGNTNCGKCEGTYKYCPASFKGEDHPYAMNWWPDGKHDTMCLPYCDGDRVLCNPAPVFKRAGGLSVIYAVSYCDKNGC